jgi:vacuolar-type H+-ATPase subunit E/Vma4
MTEMDNVSNKIIEDARAVRDDNIKEAEEKASGITAEAKSKVKEIIDKGKAEADQHYKESYDMEIFKFKASLEQKLLNTKLELVEKIIEGTKKRLAKLDREGWKKFLAKMAKEYDISSGTYMIGKDEEVVDGDLVSIIKGIKPDNAATDFSKGLKIFIGKAEILLLPENYLDTDIEDLKMEIASYLFNGEK